MTHQDQTRVHRKPEDMSQVMKDTPKEGWMNASGATLEINWSKLNTKRKRLIPANGFSTTNSVGMVIL
jgi:hypothetical protein